MKELWAPWRIEYFKKPKDKGCFLCKSFAGRKDRANLVLKRGKTCVLVINRYPYTGGHLMVAPYRHIDSLHAMTPAETSEMMALAVEATELLQKTVKPHGFNIGINIGDAAGAGLKDHIHLHVVPRWTGDTNFITVFADVRVVPQALHALWDQLKKALRKPRARSGNCR